MKDLRQHGLARTKPEWKAGRAPPPPDYGLKVQRGLDVNVVGVFRAERRERLLDVVAPEVAADADLDLRGRNHVPAGDEVEFLAELFAEVRVDRVAVAEIRR